MPEAALWVIKVCLRIIIDATCPNQTNNVTCAGKRDGLSEGQK